jgi:hypothetical protein
MNQALAHDGPCLIEVPIDPHDLQQETPRGSRVAVANGRPAKRSGSNV